MLNPICNPIYNQILYDGSNKTYIKTIPSMLPYKTHLFRPSKLKGALRSLLGVAVTYGKERGQGDKCRFRTIAKCLIALNSQS